MEYQEYLLEEDTKHCLTTKWDVLGMGRGSLIGVQLSGRIMKVSTSKDPSVMEQTLRGLPVLRQGMPNVIRSHL